MVTLSLPVPDAYERPVTRIDDGTKATYAVAGGIAVGPIPLASPYADAYGYRALAENPPAGYAGEFWSLRAVQWFVMGVGGDATIPDPVAVDVVAMLYALTVAVETGAVPTIEGMWGRIVRKNAVGQADKDKVHNWALKYGIPGI